MTEQSNQPITHLYGIRNCDTMKKALNWCDEHGVTYKFHDYKREGVDVERLKAWCEAAGGWQALINTKGTTWEKLSAEQKNLSSPIKAMALMQEFPSVIRRPLVITADGELLLGFDPIRFESFIR